MQTTEERSIVSCLVDSCTSPIPGHEAATLPALRSSETLFLLLSGRSLVLLTHPLLGMYRTIRLYTQHPRQFHGTSPDRKAPPVEEGRALEAREEQQGATIVDSTQDSVATGPRYEYLVKEEECQVEFETQVSDCRAAWLVLRHSLTRNHFLLLHQWTQ